MEAEKELGLLPKTKETTRGKEKNSIAVQR